jgi:fumarate hydratase subunit alpha
MRLLDTKIIGDEVGRLLRELSTGLPAFVRGDLGRALSLEPSPQGRAVLATILENAELSEADRLPPCQDCGLPQVLLELGREILLTGGPLKGEIERGAREAWEASFLRLSAADPITRENLGAGIPVSLECVPVEGPEARIYTLAKGGGCDNKGSLMNLPPTTDMEGIKAAILDRLLAAGPDSCPPWYVGVCVGGSFESAPRHARRALWDLAFGGEPTQRELDLSSELLGLANRSGMGPMGLGGRHSALGLRVRILPTHIASLPVAINLSCHSFRPGMAVI